MKTVQRMHIQNSEKQKIPPVEKISLKTLKMF